MGGGEYQYFPPKNFCLIVANISYCNLFVQCFRKFPVAKNFVDNGGYQVLPSENFSLTVPKNFAGESFTVSLISGIENVKDKRTGGEHQDFPPKHFCLIVPNIS